MSACPIILEYLLFSPLIHIFPYMETQSMIGIIPNSLILLMYSYFTIVFLYSDYSDIIQPYTSLPSYTTIA